MTILSFQPYCGAAPDPGAVWAAWNLDPVLITALAAVAVVYGMTWGRGASTRERVVFGAGWSLVFIAFVSPLCALTSALFAARVGHHVAVLTLGAGLLVLAAPRGRLERLFSGRMLLWSATAAQAILLWFWHAPGAYAWSLTGDVQYWIMQAGLIGAALMFWRGVRLAPIQHALLALIATMVQMGALGALITFAGEPLYAPHFATTLAWGLTPLEDQQAGGLIMWAPAAGAYLAAALILLMRRVGFGEADAGERAA